ncbi:MAG: response regulator [Peptococcaceae bacterium]|nr:response regulator [Peptococcaceae bacterium]
MGKRIMLVDDSNFARDMLKDILTKHGYEIAGEARNGREAVELFEQIKPDLITMDIAMPELDGINALNKILAANPAARVIVISSANSREIVKHVVQDGALDFVVKPFTKDRLLKAVDKALARSR